MTKWPNRLLSRGLDEILSRGLSSCDFATLHVSAPGLIAQLTNLSRGLEFDLIDSYPEVLSLT